MTLSIFSRRNVLAIIGAGRMGAAIGTLLVDDHTAAEARKTIAGLK
jgi:predicted dinucleotide-binding enzyme